MSRSIESSRAMRSTFLRIMLFVAVVTAVGCGGDTAKRVTVAGKVMLDDEPLTKGTVRFVPKSGRPASSTIQSDGSFELATESVNTVPEPGVPRGKYQVQVSSSKVIDDATIEWNVPPKYADFRTSGLEITINEPTDHLTIQLTAHDEAREP